MELHKLRSSHRITASVMFATKLENESPSPFFSRSEQQIGYDHSGYQGHFSKTLSSGAG
jgi:hypothetical protein